MKSVILLLAVTLLPLSAFADGGLKMPPGSVPTYKSAKLLHVTCELSAGKNLSHIKFETGAKIMSLNFTASVGMMPQICASLANETADNFMMNENVYVDLFVAVNANDGHSYLAGYANVSTNSQSH